MRATHAAPCSGGGGAQQDVRGRLPGASVVPAGERAGQEEGGDGGGGWAVRPVLILLLLLGDVKWSLVSQRGHLFVNTYGMPEWQM